MRDDVVPEIQEPRGLKMQSGLARLREQMLAHTADRADFLRHQQPAGLFQRGEDLGELGISDLVELDDLGAATGGFTAVLLQHGAAKVYAVDVGYGQLAWKLRNDERVVNLERTNLRYVDESRIPEPLDLAVMDVSFISIRLVLPAVKALLKPGADYICLIKPQFEAGRDEVGKKGVVRDPKVHEQVVRGIVEFARDIGFSVMGLDFSPIKGPEGNIEYICHLKNGAYEAPEPDVAAVVAASHENL